VTDFSVKPGLMDRLRQRTKRPLRYAIAGLLNTALGVAFYPALLWLFAPMRQHYMLALGISQIVCLLFAFATYRLGVFRSQGGVLREFFRFSSFYLIIYAANWLALPVLVEFAKFDPLVAQVGFTAVIVLGSYFWHSRITFKTMDDD
jgi:putative flippase GtrA